MRENDLHKVRESVDSQARLEQTLAKVGTVDALGRLLTVNTTYNLGATWLRDMAVNTISNKLAKKEEVEVLDLGCGNGTLSAKIVSAFRWGRHIGGDRLRLTATTLTALDSAVLEGNKDFMKGGYNEGVSAEFLPDEFKGKFEVVIAQSSCFAWSEYPDLCASNIAGVLKPGGILLTNVNGDRCEHPSGKTPAEVVAAIEERFIEVSRDTSSLATAGQILLEYQVRNG